MDREIISIHRGRGSAKVGPREGGTLKEHADFYILRGWLLRVFDKEEELKEAVTCALRAAVGWLQQARDEEALATLRDAGELFEVSLSDVRGRKKRKAAYEEYNLLFEELISSLDGELDGGQEGVLRTGALQLMYYAAVTTAPARCRRRFAEIYPLLSELEADGMKIPSRMRGRIRLETALLLLRKQPAESAAMFEQVVRMHSASRRGAQEPKLREKSEKRLLLFNAMLAAEGLFYAHLRMLHPLRAIGWHLYTCVLFYWYVGLLLGRKLCRAASMLRQAAEFFLERLGTDGLLFAMMMTLLMAMAHMCMNR